MGDLILILMVMNSAHASLGIQTGVSGRLTDGCFKDGLGDTSLTPLSALFDTPRVSLCGVGVNMTPVNLTPGKSYKLVPCGPVPVSTFNSPDRTNRAIVLCTVRSPIRAFLESVLIEGQAPVPSSLA